MSISPLLLSPPLLSLLLTQILNLLSSLFLQIFHLFSSHHHRSCFLQILKISLISLPFDCALFTQIFHLLSPIVTPTALASYKFHLSSSFFFLTNISTSSPVTTTALAELTNIKSPRISLLTNISPLLLSPPPLLLLTNIKSALISLSYKYFTSSPLTTTALSSYKY
ncbi:hypothetical protein CEXT_49191 [Caerostris extrusa]|uniref:Uncharacterized protein n=1 Tax=Caerostris extrusa TaxID=172846 RepID=A0AAV4QDS6_CAEEX|nr:hypothetical protein CEXT_49191 [Caerostris extrusa]